MVNLNTKNELNIDLFNSKDKMNEWIETFMLNDLSEIRAIPQNIYYAIQQIDKDLLLGKSFRSSRVKKKNFY
jgi:hypothetical protein